VGVAHGDRLPGTDAEQPWFLLVLSVAPAAILLAGRLTRTARSRSCWDRTDRQIST